MGFSLNDLNPFAKGHIFDNALRGIDDMFDLTGKEAAGAAEEAAAIQKAAGLQASTLLDPFKTVGEQGLSQASFLTDPNAQYDFLQNNPMFKLALDNANTRTENIAAAGGRLGANDFQQSLTNNALMQAMPFIQDQKQSIGGLLDYGLTTASNQGNLLTGAAAAEAGGIVGAQNARTQGHNNLLDLAGASYDPLSKLAIKGYDMIFSDERLKENVKRVGSKNGFNIYSWSWNSAAKKLGLDGDSLGVIAQEVKKTNPNAVCEVGGYLKVNYNMIGV